MENRASSGLFGYLSLFTSLGTLLCCALPSLFVLFGLGATVASFLAAAPWMVALSRHKTWVFTLSAGLIAANFAYVYGLVPRLRGNIESCSPKDRSCEAANRFGLSILWVSAMIYVAGFFTAYVLGPLLFRFG